MKFLCTHVLQDKKSDVILCTQVQVLRTNMNDYYGYIYHNGLGSIDTHILYKNVELLKTSCMLLQAQTETYAFDLKFCSGSFPDFL